MSRRPWPGPMLALATPPWTVAARALAAISTGSATCAPGALVVATDADAALVSALALVVATDAAAALVSALSPCLADLVGKSESTSPTMVPTNNTATTDRTMPRWLGGRPTMTLAPAG